MSDSIDKTAEHAYAFLQRWSQRKQQQQHKPVPQPAVEPPSSNDPPTTLTEAELPPIESLHEDSEVSMFLHENISESLRRAALRKLFHMGKFNVCDGLDDYADDYSVFQTLQGVLTAQEQMHHITEKFEQHREKTEAADDQVDQSSETVAVTDESSDTSTPEAQPPEEN